MVAWWLDGPILPLIYAGAVNAESSRQFVQLDVAAGWWIALLGVIAVLIAEAHEWAEAHWVNKRLRTAAVVQD